MSGPRALILSGSIGNGHRVVAEACAAALLAGGWSPRTEDCIALLGKARAALALWFFRFLVHRPALYDGFHFAYLRAGAPRSRLGSARATKRAVSALRNGAELERGDLVLSVFSTGAAVGAELVRQHRGVRSVVFCTDATAHSMWVEGEADLYLTTCELAAATVRRYRPSASVAVVPPPVRGAFYRARPRESARAALGLDPASPCVLVAAGGWGLAPLAPMTRALSERGLQVLAVAGGNRRLERELRALEARRAGVRAYGFTNDMPELLAAADLVVTTPGQTCHEARVVGRRLVLLDVIPGHGRENLLHELERGGAVGSSAEPEAVAAAVTAALERPEPRGSWPVASESEWQERFLTALGEIGPAPGSFTGTASKVR